MMEIIDHANGYLDTGLLCALLYKVGAFEARLQALEDWVQQYKQRLQEKKHHEQHRRSI